MPFWGETFFVETAKVGAYEFSPREADLPQPTPISLNEENVILNGNAKLEGNYIFIGQGTLTNPQIGDVRVSFKGVRTGQTVTLFGKLENGNVEPYYYKENVGLYRVLTGSRDDAISQMAKEYKVNLWLFRGLGFLMMWLGLNLILGPISTFLDVVPILGSISRGLIGVILFVITLILSTITIIISKLFHNVLILLLIVLLVMVGGFFFLKRKRKQET